MKYVNSFCPRDAIWQHRSGSTLAQVMACCLTAPSRYLNQCWLIISKVHWHSSEGNFTRNQYWRYLSLIWVLKLPIWDHSKKSIRHHWVYSLSYAFFMKLPSGKWCSISLNSGSDNGLVPSDSKPLPEPMLTKFYNVIWHYNFTTSMIFTS